MQTMTCETCGGSGKVADPRAVGKQMKAKRNAHNITLREVSRRMGLSAAYVCDLEHGRRAWPFKIQQAFLKALSK